MAENFRNRKGYFSINVQTIAAADLKINNIVAHWPGATHDQRIFDNSFIKHQLESGHFGKFIIVGDSGYTDTMYMATPLPNPVTNIELLYNESQIRTRNVVERSYGVLKRRFPVLSLGMRLHMETIKNIIVACAVLHNLCIDQRDRLPPVEVEGFGDMLNATAMPIPLPIPDVGIRRSRRQCVRDQFLAGYFQLVADNRVAGIMMPEEL